MEINSLYIEEYLVRSYPAVEPGRWEVPSPEALQIRRLVIDVLQFLHAEVRVELKQEGGKIFLHIESPTSPAGEN